MRRMEELSRSCQSCISKNEDGTKLCVSGVLVSDRAEILLTNGCPLRFGKIDYTFRTSTLCSVKVAPSVLYDLTI